MPAKIYDIVGSTDNAQLLIAAVQDLESRAHRLGLTIGARALNNAKNAIGWELAGDVPAADKASRGERVGL